MTKILLFFAGFVVFTGFAFYSCNPPTKKVQVKNDTLMMEAIYVINGSTLQPTAGPVKRVVTMMDYIDSSSGDRLIKSKLDTVYLLPNTDTSMVFLDSAKKPILDKFGQKQYGTSFKNPLYLNKAFVHPLSIQFPNIH